MHRSSLTAACMLWMSVAAAHAQSSDAVLDRIELTNGISIGHRKASIPFLYLNENRGPGRFFDVKRNYFCRGDVWGHHGKLSWHGLRH